MTTPPSGFIARPKVRSTAAAVSLGSHDRIVSVAKNALQAYIESFMSTTGSNRLFTAAISPAALQYVTDKSLQDSPDPNKKPVQLARYLNDLRTKMPCIMIVDSGVSWEEPGLGGGLERTASINGNWQGWYRIEARVNVVVAAVANDQETSSLLMGLLSIFFKQLRVEAGGSRMTSDKPGDNWEVRVPINFSSTINQPTNVADDPKDQIWASSIELELQVEDLFSIERPVQRFVLEEGIIGESNLEAAYAPTITAPESVKLRDGPFMIRTGRLSDHHRIVLSDGSIASLEVDAGVVTPHRTGSFDIMVIDQTKQQGSGPAPWASLAVTTHTVVVTF